MTRAARTALASVAALGATLVALGCLVPATAFANPTVGLALGKTESKQDAQNGADANSTVGLFVRGRLSHALQLQAELSKLQDDGSSGTTIRTWNAALLYDFGHGSVVPFALVGLGFDVLSYSDGYTSDQTSTHAELGAGVEYRFGGGFVLGADVRLGSRSGTQSQTYPVGIAANGGASPGIVPAYTAPSYLSDGEYRSMRLTLGVHF